jgi:hypothetical protein
MEREGGAAEPRAVLGTTRRSTTRLVEIRTKHGVVVTTPEHPFAKIDSGWTPAGELAEGDLVVDRASPRGTPILAVATRTVPPTTVYNLTVDKTHSYLVGRQGLLVHNVDCTGTQTLQDHLNWKPITRKPTLAELLAEERRKEKEELRKRLEEERKQREAASNPNCRGCVVAALTDNGDVSSFLEKHNNGKDPTPREMSQLMHDSGVIDLNTPSPKAFPPSTSTSQRLKKMAEGKVRPESAEFDKVQTDAHQFMRDSSSNTFVVTYKFYDGARHQSRTILAVRGADGTIDYLNPSKDPPQIHYRLDELTTSIAITPTNVDWRFNRNLKKMIDAAN